MLLVSGCSVGAGSGSVGGAGGSVGASVGAGVGFGFDDDELLCGLLLDEELLLLLLDELCELSLLLLSGFVVSFMLSTFVFFALLSLSASMKT